MQPDSLNPVVNAGMHFYNFEPLGLSYVAATVEDYHDLCLIDLNNEAEPDTAFRQTIRAFQPDVIAFSARTSSNTGRVLQLAQITKDIDRKIITVVGGIHVMLWPYDFFQKVDVVIWRNPMGNFPVTVKMIAQGRRLKVVQAMIDTSFVPSVTLQSYPNPNRELSTRYKYHIAIGRPGFEQVLQPVVSIKTSSGCPYRCNFCCLWKICPRYEIRDIAGIVQEIASLTPENIFLADDESFIEADYMFELAGAIISSGINKRFIMYTRADTVAKNPWLLEKWASAGLVEAWIGIDGFSDKQLEAYKKEDTTTSHAKAINICRQNAVSVHGTSMINQNFTQDDFDHLLNYTSMELGLTSCHFFVLTPFKGTVLYERTNPNNLLTDNSDHFSLRQTVLKPHHMSVEEFHRRYADLQKYFNSDSMPYTARVANFPDQLLPEFGMLVKENENLYQAILRVSYE
ncbi:MAG: radical SAM protein [Patescibacteria group bacterium]